MSSIVISLIVFLCLFGGGLLGMRLRMALPEHHLTDDSRHVLETGLGIIGTIGGLVLGLLVASAFGNYSAQRNELIEMSANAALLDRVLAHYGSEANESRRALRVSLTRILDQMWPTSRSSATEADPSAAKAEALYDKIESLTPKNDTQRSIKGEAIALATSIGQTRYLMFEQLTLTISLPLLVVLTFWFTITFVGLGIFAPTNRTVVFALLLAAIAVSGAVFIIQEMYTPYQGLIQVPSTPLRDALAHLGQP